MLLWPPAHFAASNQQELSEIIFRASQLDVPPIDQILADEDSSGDVLWALTDHEGSVRDLVENSGNVDNRITYDAYGKITSETNSAVDHIFGYTGRECDVESDL